MFLAAGGRSATPVTAITGSSAPRAVLVRDVAAFVGASPPAKSLGGEAAPGRHPVVPALDHAKLLDALEGRVVETGYTF